MKRVVANEGIGVVPGLCEPIPVQVPLVAVPVEVRDDQVAVRVTPCCTKYHLEHCPSKASRFLPPISGLYFIRDQKSQSTSYQVASFFEKSRQILSCKP